MRSITKDVPWVALTATASAKVTEDIFKNLSLNRSLKKLKIPCFRSNLYYDVTFKEILQDEFDDLAVFIVDCLGDDWESNRGPSSSVVIVYCRTREDTETVANKVNFFSKNTGRVCYEASIYDRLI